MTTATMRVFFVRPDGSLADVVDIGPHNLNAAPWFGTWTWFNDYVESYTRMGCVLHVRIHPANTATTPDDSEQK